MIQSESRGHERINRKLDFVNATIGQECAVGEALQDARTCDRRGTGEQETRAVQAVKAAEYVDDAMHRRSLCAWSGSANDTQVHSSGRRAF